jgi:predicted outer membrane repeat protein
VISSTSVSSSNFSYNAALSSDGGGIYVSFGVPYFTISDSMLDFNTASGCGGGMATTSAEGYQITSMSMSSTSFEHNSAIYGGGACLRSTYSLSILTQTMSDNSASTAGGALYMAECTPLVKDYLSLDPSTRYARCART